MSKFPEVTLRETSKYNGFLAGWKATKGSYGGSSPPRQNGLHRQIRQIPLRLPQTAPYFSTAPMK